MNIQSTAPRLQIQTATAASAPAAQTAPPEESKPSNVETFTRGAASGADRANGLIGAWAGGAGLAMTGAVAGTALSLGGDIIGAARGVITGDAAVTLQSVFEGAMKAGGGAIMSAAIGGGVGAVVGGVGGFYAGRGLGRVSGAVGSGAAKLVGADKQMGNAIGKAAFGVALGVAGASVGAFGYSLNAGVVAVGMGVGGGLLALAQD